jgi:diguanylate cyclase (GGDEF)-like protein
MTATDMNAHRTTMPARQSAVIARALGVSWPLQVLIVAIWLVVPHPPDADETLVVALTLLGAPLYLPLLLPAPPPFTRVKMNVASVIGIAQMSALVWAGGGLSSGFALLALWFLPLTACSLPRTDSAAHILVVIAGCAIAVVAEAPGEVLTHGHLWGLAVVGVATMIVNTAIVSYLYGVLRVTTDRFAHRSVHDPLTGLANRTLLNQRMAALTPGDGAVYVLDVDGFKFINDSLGHRAGDHLLTMIARRLRRHARDGDVLARLGGDEFVLLAVGVGDEASALALGRRLLDACAAPFSFDGEEAEVSVSAGASLLADAESGELALRNADLALFAAKEDQGGSIRMFAAPMREIAANRLSLERHLRRALDHDELHVVYQPIVTLDGGEVTGAEALLRWRPAGLGDVSPAEFVPIAERTGLILPIGRFVLTRALEQLAAWRAAGHDLSVSVNLSAGQLADEHLPELLAALLHRHGLPADAVRLELTESALMSRATAQPLAALDRLRATGALLVLDDFGTGYSSLSRISRLRLSVIKIDQSFIATMDRDPAARAIVAAVLQMAGPLGTAVVAEGVETEEQRRALVELGCPLGQGYLFGRPGPPEAVVALLRAPRAVAAGAA